MSRFKLLLSVICLLVLGGLLIGVVRAGWEEDQELPTQHPDWCNCSDSTWRAGDCALLGINTYFVILSADCSHDFDLLKCTCNHLIVEKIYPPWV